MGYKKLSGGKFRQNGHLVVLRFKLKLTLFTDYDLKPWVLLILFTLFSLQMQGKSYLLSLYFF